MNHLVKHLLGVILHYHYHFQKKSTNTWSTVFGARAAWWRPDLLRTGEQNGRGGQGWYQEIGRTGFWLGKPGFQSFPRKKQDDVDVGTARPQYSSLYSMRLVPGETKCFIPLISKIKKTSLLNLPSIIIRFRMGFPNDPFSASHHSCVLCFATSSNVTPVGPASCEKYEFQRWHAWTSSWTPLYATTWIHPRAVMERTLPKDWFSMKNMVWKPA